MKMLDTNNIQSKVGHLVETPIRNTICNFLPSSVEKSLYSLIFISVQRDINFLSLHITFGFNV
jgi:hypothetical protein